MNEFIGLDFGSYHCRTGIYRSKNFEVIRNHYDHHETESFRGPDEYFRKRDVDVPAFLALRQLLGTDQKIPEVQKGILDRTEKLFRTILEEVSLFCKSDTINGVVTVPCYYHDRERFALMSLAERAGFNSIKLLDENVAVALGLDQCPEARNILIYSQGADPFSCTLGVHENMNFRTLNSAFDNELQGTFYDAVILKKILEALRYEPQKLTRQELEYLIRKSKQAKTDLSEKHEATITIPVNIRKGPDPTPVSEEKKIPCTRTEFEAAIGKFVARTLEVCAKTVHDAGLHPQDIDLVIVSGGLTSVPLVQQMILDMFKSEIVVADINAATRGAALFASSLPEPAVREKTKHSPAPSKTIRNMAPVSPPKTGELAAEWVKLFAIDIEDYYDLWQKEEFSRAIEKMEHVQENISRYIANLCHSAGRKHLDNGFLKEAYTFLKKGHNYDKTNDLILVDLLKCFDQLINDAHQRKDYHVTMNYLKEALQVAPGRKNWKDLLSFLRNNLKNLQRNPGFRKF